jgi:hypothetical protein
MAPIRNPRRLPRRHMAGRAIIDTPKGMDYVEATVDVDFDDIDGAEKEAREHYGRLKDAED